MFGRSSRHRDRPAIFDHSHRLFTSWLIPPGALFAIRALFSLYGFVTLFTVLGLESTYDKRSSFSYFTELTFYGLSFYMLFAAIHTFTYWRSGQPLLVRWPKILQHLHAMYYSTIVVYPFIVTLVYWSIIYTPPFPDRLSLWSNVTKHGLNSLYALFELTIPRTAPLPWLHVIAIILVLACYLGVAFITHETEHFFTYDFLDYSKHSAGYVAGFIVGILVGACVVFAIIHFLIKLRVWITETKMGMTGKFSRRHYQPHGEHGMESVGMSRV